MKTVRASATATKLPPKPLNDSFIKTLKRDDSGVGRKYSDGSGLYLHTKNGGKYWRMAYRFDGKQKLLAVGVYPSVSLADAREIALAAKKGLAKGVDPSEAKQQAAEQSLMQSSTTFEAVAKQWLETPNSRRSEQTQAKIARWFEVDINPVIGKLAIHKVTAKAIIDKVLRPLERANTIEKTHRVKQVIGQVFRFAVASGYVERDPTTDIKETLATKIVVNHAALVEPKDVAGLLRAMYSFNGHPITEAALKLAPLLFVRPGELRMAEWVEIDFDARVWRIPASKMKMNNDHVVPLAKQSIGLLQGLHSLTGHDRYIFSNTQHRQRPMSENTINAALASLGYGKGIHTGHGFRATARTILDEVLGERVDLVEHQLAHAVKDVNGRAYNRTSHLPERKAMMQRWADYLDQLRNGATVIPLKVTA
jgi:integrase